MLDPFSLPFFQRGVVEVLLLAVAAGLLGTWIVLRGMAFFAHAVGTATFPGLVLADGLGFSATLGALGAALVMAVLVGLLARRRGTGTDSVTALALAVTLALGVVLASDVFGSQARVDRLLFGSLLLIDGADLRLAAAAALAVAVAALVIGPRWLATGFAGEQRGAGRQGAADAALVVLVALVAVAALAAVGALLATALMVVPAATTRLAFDRMRSWQLATVVLTALEGVGGLWLAFQLDVPPGAAIAVLAGVVFALVAAGRALALSRRPAPALAALALAAALGVAGCGSGSGSNPGRPVVAATTTQLGDLARQIGGPAVDVRQILRSNSDPHEYEPRPKDVQAVADARLLLTSGRGIDDWAGQVVKDSGTDARVVDVGAAIPVVRASTEGGGDDPHWWHDPRNVLAATTTIERALIAAAPADRAAIERRAAAYRARLRLLDADIRACIDRVPRGERRIVTDHDALGYFAARYGISVVGAVIPSSTTRAQASAGDLAALERTIRREHVRAVFPEHSVNAKLAERIASDTGAGADETLYGDTLGPQGSRAGTYLGMEAENAQAIARGMSAGTGVVPDPLTPTLLVADDVAATYPGVGRPGDRERHLQCARRRADRRARSQRRRQVDALSRADR